MNALKTIHGRILNPTKKMMEDAGLTVNDALETPEETLEIVAPEEHIFSKLKIRRALRRMGKEEMLDAMLEADGQFRKDWTDAQEIDLYDEAVTAAKAKGIVTEEFLTALKGELQNDL